MNTTQTTSRRTAATIRWVRYYVTASRQTIAHVYYELERAGYNDDAADDVLDAAGVVASPEQVNDVLVHFAAIT